MHPAPDTDSLRGPEKAAVLFLCLQEEKGSDLMRKLGEDEVAILTQSLATLGVISAPVVDGVIREFAEAVAGGAGVIGNVEAARRILSSALPEARVAELLDDINSPGNGRSIWENFGALNEQVIYKHLEKELDQMVAAVLSKVKPDVAARVLPLFGAERMTDIIQRMFRMDNLPRHVLDVIEETVATEYLPAATRKVGPDPHQRMADLFNKMDSALFEPLAEELEKRAPEEFASIKAKMFTFDDLVRLDRASLQRIMRNVDEAVQTMALRGAKKPVRDAFLEAYTQRKREMKLEEMAALERVRARDVREAQSQIVDTALELARQDIIRLPADDEQMIE